MRQEEADKLESGDWVSFIFSRKYDPDTGVWTEESIIGHVTGKPQARGRVTIRPVKRGDPYGKARSVRLKNVRGWSEQ